jgi:hypothetical protein
MGGSALYSASDGNWYRSGDGINFILVTNTFITYYSYFDGFAYYYDYFYLQFGFPPYKDYYGVTPSGCAPF